MQMTRTHSPTAPSFSPLAIVERPETTKPHIAVEAEAGARRCLHLNRTCRGLGADLRSLPPPRWTQVVRGSTADHSRWVFAVGKVRSLGAEALSVRGTGPGGH